MYKQKMTEEIRSMLRDAGFEPTWMRDIADGDTIAIEHEINEEGPAEMVVSRMWVMYNSGHAVHKFIGELPDGRLVHCTYGAQMDCWVKRP